MFLRRLATGIRQRDWLLILIELVLVIAGVLIALQFDNWNTVNRNQAALNETLGRVDAELDLNRQVIADISAKISEHQETRSSALSALEACDDRPEARREIDFILSDLTRDYSPSLSSTTLEQLNRRDAFLELLSSEFRSQLAVYTNLLHEEQTQLATNAGLRWDMHIIRHPAVSARFGEEGGMVVNAPLSDLCQNASFKRQFYITVAFVESTRLRLERFEAQMDLFQSALDAEISQRR